ncbi:hypothetical protein QWY85_06655 [Neolewinella lacunae]|uniref:Lipoprotein n=1 Tax=Neolewinella lacunae TaxID=1517758 RepID=A0A923T6K6_9BACT|nr:hypothetical protein [Neolewinella lacunae]MBC6992589.1 hypothetical protein [Neolewinella lacunae]MDN3634330.1 hypothetical protein [Neolewinella lacunae]
MKIPAFSLLLFALLGFVACEKENLQPEPALNPERVNFQAPEVGQFNTFEMFSYACGEALPEAPSTLTLTITGVTETEIEFTESYSSRTDSLVFTADRKPGNLLISPEERASSSLFFFYGSDSLRFMAPPVASLQYRDCVFYNGDEKFTGDYVARVPSFTFGDTNFRNLKSVSCVPVILDLDGYLLYDEHSLKASISTSTSEFGGEETTFTTVYLLQ